MANIFYWDGNPITTTRVANSAQTTQNFPFNIGVGLTNGYSWNGGLDDVRLYNRALSATESLNLYQSTRACLFGIRWG